MKVEDVKYVTIGDEIIELEEGLFEQMVNLEQVDFSNVAQTMNLPKRCFKGCVKLKRIVG